MDTPTGGRVLSVTVGRAAAPRRRRHPPSVARTVLSLPPTDGADVRLTSPGDQERWSVAGRTAAQATVLALVVGATTAFSALHKTVTVEVDGQVSTVSAFGRTVEDVLAAHGVRPGAQDLVVPALDALVTDDDEIVVRLGRSVVVEVDGEERTVWTTALTVGDVVAELGLRGDLRTSSSRSDVLGRDVLRVSTPKSVHVAVDGATTELVTTATSVREVLREQGVVLGAHDLVSVPLDAPAVEGLVVKVTRVLTEVRSETTTTPFETVREDDPDLDEGREVVVTAGQEGRRTVTFRVLLVDGAEIGRVPLLESGVREPVTRVVRVGTRVVPETPPPPPFTPVSPGTARAIALDMVLARGWDETQFACLDALWTKESGWRVDAENRSSGAYGIPQSLPGSKMASAGEDWRTNAATQITWGLGYIAGRYGAPCGAWEHSKARNWY
jgi:resuscitation-promoting factor RpfB